MVRIWIDWLIKRRTQRFYGGEPDDGNRWEEKGTFERAMVVVVAVMHPCFFLIFCFFNFGPLPFYLRRFLLICGQFFVFFFFVSLFVLLSCAATLFKDFLPQLVGHVLSSKDFVVFAKW